MGSAHITAKGLGILYPIDGTLVIGSAQACRILVKGAAPRHCQIYRSSEGVLLKDLTGQNLVTVNGISVSRQILKNGDVVRVSSEEFQYSEADEAIPVALPCGEESYTLAEAPRESRRPPGKGSRRIPKMAAPPVVYSPRPASPPAQTSSSIRWWMLGGAALVVIGLVVGVSLGRNHGSAKRDATAAPSAGVPRRESTPPARPAVRVPSDPLGPAELCQKLNVLMIAAQAAACRGEIEKAARLQDWISTTWAQLSRDTSGWPPDRLMRELPPHLEPGDVLLEFDRMNLRRADKEEAIKRIQDFLGALRPGAMLQVACARGGRRLELFLLFKGLPPGTREIAQWVSSGSGPPPAEPPTEAASVPETASDLPRAELASAPPLSISPSPASSPQAPRFSLKECGVLLRDPSRVPPADQGDLARSLRSWGTDSPPARVAAYFLPGALGSGGMRSDVSQAWSGYLDAHSLESFRSLSPKEHAAIAEELLLRGPKSRLLRLISLVHLLEAAQSDAAFARLAAARGFGETQDKKLWGEPEQIFHHRVCQYYGQSGKDEPPLEAIALNYPQFGPRYVGLLLEIQKTLSRGWGFQNTFFDITQLDSEGGPRGARDHLRALAASYKDAIYCKQCKEGLVVCSQCQGKAKVDIPCSDCNGSGRTMAPGAANGALVTQRCRKCEGKKIFRGVGCPTCSKTGTVACETCQGRPWRDISCVNRGCQGGMVRCSSCQGKGRTDLVCPICNGTGRTMAPGAANGAIVTQKCRNCEENHGVFKQGQECKNCKAKGWVKCDSCQGATHKVVYTVALDSVYRLEACRSCGGVGWPDPQVALPCESCAGLGVRAKPQADPAKTLD
jgi:hypothetical protein